MRKILACFLVLITFSIPNYSQEAESQCAQALEFSGFTDLQYWGDLSRNQKPEYHWGQVELDFAKCINPLVSFEGAVAYDPDAESFGIGAAFVQLNILGCPGDNLIMSRQLQNCSIVIGQFDIPFGIDWKVYPSLDRKLISAPLIVDDSHGAWNSTGVMLYGEKAGFNGVIFNAGFSDPADADSNHYDNLGEMLGGRLGFKPFKNLEIGGSFATDIVSGYPYKPSLAGFDIQFNYGLWQFKGEFIRKDYDNNYYAEKTGGYGEIMFNPGKYFALYRGELAQTGGAEDVQRHCLGLGYILSDGIEFRSEYQANPDTEDFLLLQTAIGF